MKNIIISEKQLSELVGKVNKIDESHDDGSYMAKQQLFTLATMAYTMWEKMEDGEQLEDWMESKIAQAEQSVTPVVKGYMYDEFSDKETQGIAKLNSDEIIIGQ